jgi:hypothetical protein
MPDREPEPWQSGAAGPFLWIEVSAVELWALGGDRFAVRAPGHEQLVTGLDGRVAERDALARVGAHALARSASRRVVAG